MNIFIYENMIRKGYTVYSLSKELKVSFSCVKGWVNGTRQPNYENMDKLCFLFNCSMDDLYSAANENKKFVNPLNELALREPEKNSYLTFKLPLGAKVLYKEIASYEQLNLNERFLGSVAWTISNYLDKDNSFKTFLKNNNPELFHKLDDLRKTIGM